MKRRSRQDRGRKDSIEERFLHLGSGYFLDRETGRVVAL
jgi:hypothetical protein